MSESIAPERSRYDENFRREAVNHWLCSGKPAYVVAQELGIRLHQLYVWRKRYGPAAVGGRAAAGPPHAKAPSIDQLQAELAAAQREIRHLREQRDILKKTLGIVSQPQPGDTNGSTR
jgi:transposase-like protein